MVRRSAPPINGWVLRKSSEIVRKLEREAGTGWIMVGDSKRLGIERVRLLVPSGIEVFDVIAKYWGAWQLFFSTQEGKEGLAYLSVVESCTGSLNFMKNVGNLLAYPWYGAKESALVFRRIEERYSYSPVIGLTPSVNQRHPLLPVAS